MFVLYYTNINNIVSFCIGLAVTTLSEHIAKLFIVIGDNFNLILAKVLKKISGIDLTDELKDKTKPTKENNNNNVKQD